MEAEEDLVLQELEALREKQLREEDDRRIRKHSELLRLEVEKEAREEGPKMEEIERRAIEEWKIKTAEGNEKR